MRLNGWEGQKRERKRERIRDKLHSWEMRMVTMATAAESHMMQRSEREGGERMKKKKRD